MYEYPVDDPESEYLGDRRHLFQQERHFLPGAQAFDLATVQFAGGHRRLGIRADGRDDYFLREARKRSQPDVNAGEGPANVNLHRGSLASRMGHAQDVLAGRERECEAPTIIRSRSRAGSGAHRSHRHRRARPQAHDTAHRVHRLLCQQRARRAGQHGRHGGGHQQPRKHGHPSSRSADACRTSEKDALGSSRMPSLRRYYPVQVRGCDLRPSRLATPRRPAGT